MYRESGIWALRTVGLAISMTSVMYAWTPGSATSRTLQNKQPEKTVRVVRPLNLEALARGEDGLPTRCLRTGTNALMASGAFQIAYWVSDTVTKAPQDTVFFMIIPFSGLATGCADGMVTRMGFVLRFPYDMAGDSLVDTMGRCFLLDSLFFLYSTSANFAGPAQIILTYRYWSEGSGWGSVIAQDTLVIDASYGTPSPTTPYALILTYPSGIPISFAPNQKLGIEMSVRYTQSTDTIFVALSGVDSVNICICDGATRQSHFPKTTYGEVQFSTLNMACNYYSNDMFSSSLIDFFCGNNDGAPNQCEFLVSNWVISAFVSWYDCASTQVWVQGPDRVCPDDTIDVVGTAVGCPPLQVAWYVNGNSQAPLTWDSFQLVPPLASGPQEIVWEVVNQCGAMRDTLIVNVVPLVSFQIGQNQDTLFPIVTVATPPITLTWILPDGSTVTNQDTIIATVEGDYCLVLQDTCSVDTVCIRWSPGGGGPTGLSTVVAGDATRCLVRGGTPTQILVECPSAGIVDRAWLVSHDGRILEDLPVYSGQQRFAIPVQPGIQDGYLILWQGTRVVGVLRVMRSVAGVRD